MASDRWDDRLADAETATDRLIESIRGSFHTWTMDRRRECVSQLNRTVARLTRLRSTVEASCAKVDLKIVGKDAEEA